MNRLLLIVFVSLMFSSCSIVQIMFTEQSSNNLKVINNNYVFENDTIKVTYSFWAEDGVMAFIIENKLDIPIYIDWKKSAFISTKNKFSYYSENEVTDTKGVGASAMYLYRNVYDWSRWYPVNVSVSESRSVKYKEERITFVPPHAATERASYNIYPRKYIIMDNIKSTQIGDSKAKGKVVSFSNDDAMITFRNFLTYSTKETFDTEKYVSNDFYEGKVVELAKKHYTNYEDSKNFYVVPY